MRKIIFGVSIFLGLKVNAQFKLNGKIVDENGNPVSFATVMLVNSQFGTQSNIDGSFEITNLKGGLVFLQIKSIGYEDKRDSIVLNENSTIGIILKSSNKNLDEVVVNATRVSKNSGMAFNNMDAEQIKKLNLGQDAPYVLAQLPSVVVNSDAGAGIGYTGLRIRGSDATRVNVTINGVPINDAESQATFFVDMPDIISSANNVQVQRGAGASSNGAGAFGASINFQTNQLNAKPYANLISTAGSFNSFRNTIAAGTGLINNKFTVDARASSIASEGYIDRASSNLKSYYLSAGYYGKNTVLKFINFFGYEKTYQAWNYVPEDSVKSGNRTFNSCGLWIDNSGKIHYYKNETDNYQQNNFQLHWIKKINNRLTLNLTSHYTKGEGYYEQFRYGDFLSNYNIQPLINKQGDTITQSNITRRLWLNNDFVGGIFNLNFIANSKLNFILGGGYNTYYGKHYNQVRRADYMPGVNLNYQYMFYSTNKNDGNIYLKTNYSPFKDLNLFLDLQTRVVDYRYYGLYDTVNKKQQTQSYGFFNPKIGMSFGNSDILNFYASLSVAHKEPGGDDLTKNKVNQRPKAEELFDWEYGMKSKAKKINYNINIYQMIYKNQLVLNGQIDNVGNPRHINVANSYRRGIEFELNSSPVKYFSFAGNITLSENKILNYKEYLDSSDANYNYYPQHINTYKSTDIAYSPNIISCLVFTFKPVKNIEISYIYKKVGRQYLDNSGFKDRSINPYEVSDFRINYRMVTKIIPEINLMFGAFNIFGAKYSTNGYSYSSYFGRSLVSQNWFAPAALTNFLGGVNIKF